jgi:hypothetical protein
MKKLSLRARATLHYFVNSDMSISADRLAEEVAEGRKAIQAALRELRDANLITTRKERVGNRVVTVSYVTEQGFLEVHSWGSQNVLQIQHTVQNSSIQVLAYSAKSLYESTGGAREEENELGYEFFEKTSSGDDELTQARLKHEAQKKAEYQDAKAATAQKRFSERKNRVVKDWSATDVSFEFANRVHEFFHIKPWQVTKTRFTQALGEARKKHDTNGEIEVEMLNLFFASMDFSKYSDADALWKIFISRFSELSSQAKLRINSSEDLETAKVQADEQWKKEFGEDFNV